jgi:NAD(P)-dependent dehydrogenase (short-subunit alcohol dehydrogenase family)
MDLQSVPRLGPPEGARIVLAGGAGGIGRTLAEASRRSGYDVVVLDLAASIEALPASPGATSIAFDGRDPGSIEHACEEVGREGRPVDGFVFLSGFPILPRRPVNEVTVSQWDELMAVNLRSANLLMGGLLPQMRNAAAPAVVTVASSLGYQVMPGMGAYAASKAGLVGLTKAIAVENAPWLRANTVAPGAVETSFLGGGTGRANDGGDRAWFDSIVDRYVSTIPLGRVAFPNDIVGPILFLLGPASAYMTGQVLHLNGGRMTP